VTPSATPSAIDTTSQTQKIAVDTAASPSGPMRVPTQYASIDAKSVIRRFDATAGMATRRMTRGSASSTSAPAATLMPSCLARSGGA
jgi:hypothetical protein